MVAPKKGAVAKPKGVSAKPEEAAKAHLAKYAKDFGVSPNDLTLAATAEVPGGNVVKFDQVVGGAPVLGGQLVVSVDSAGGMESVSGETSASAKGTFPKASKLVQSRFSSKAVRTVAAREKAKSTKGFEAESKGAIWVDPKVLGLPDGGKAVPTYHFQVTGNDVRYEVYINARTGEVELAYNNLHHALNRVVCDKANGTITGDPATYACDGDAVAHTRTEGQGPSGVADVDQVYDYFEDVSVRFASYVDVDVTELIGTDLRDGKGKALRGTTRVCMQWSPTAPPCPYPNAFWDGTQMVFGEGNTVDDVTGHELAHGVTERTSQLVYLFQSGAINEGLSDFWGEIVDLGNKEDDDTAENRWKIGEGSNFDEFGYPNGVIRDMKNPGEFDQPDTMTSDLWVDDPSMRDNGGVHGNSGVFNKAGYLMVDGDTFNGYTIKGIGPAKASKVVWTLQNLLTAGADYKDVFNLLPISCRKNVGKPGTFITEADCAEVDKVVRATEMYKDPNAGAAKNVDYCEAGQTVQRVYVEDFEKKNGGWTFDGDANQGGWILGSEVGYRNNTTGKDAAVAWVVEGNNVFLTQKAPITIPENGLLRFDHSYMFATQNDPQDPFGGDGRLDGG
ncbi:MAG TPA: M4 family metallopeptidase, partial [Actinopolymorphaceae bacterium]